MIIKLIINIIVMKAKAKVIRDVEEEKDDG